MAEFSSYPHGTPNWVDISWNDQAAAAAFYGSLFGWEALDAGPDAGGYTMFTLGGKTVAGLSPKMGEGQPSVWTSYIGVDDADAIAAAITAAGGKVLFGPMQVLDAGTMATFMAPDGSFAALWQPDQHPGASLANEPGTFTWNELQSRDVASANDFFTKVFGWSPESVDFGDSPYTMFKVGEAPVAGMTAMPEMVPAEVPSYWLVYFTVASTDESAAAATGLGATLYVGPLDSPVGRLAVLGDPEGAPFALIQHQPPS